MISYKQLSLANVFDDCQEKFQNDKHSFLKLLQDTINLDKLIPASFYRHYHSYTGRSRGCSLYSMLWALILQKIFSIPTDSLLLIFLQYSSELREFCGFDKVPDPSKITRFKQDFLPDLQSMFHNLVDITEPICQKIDLHKATMLIFDTSGIEAYVTENNPKYAHRIIKQLKALKKVHNLGNSYDPYKLAYSSMPSHSASNPAIQQMYVNGHFCYSYKFGIITNGLGIVRDISLYNKDFLKAHPDIILKKKSDSPDEDKSLADAKALLPTLKDFFQKHPLITPNIFIGDAAFDSIDIYKTLLGDMKFDQAFIPLKVKLSLEDAECPLNEYGIPCCPHDSSLPMKPESSKSHLRSGLPSRKFVCPKMNWRKDETGKHRRICHCDNPCTDSPSGRMTYIYPEKNLRAYPGILRNSVQWDETYKIRTTVERNINQFKDSFCIANRRTQNEKTLHADLLFAGITQLITVVVADKINKREFLRSLKPLIA